MSETKSKTAKPATAKSTAAKTGAGTGAKAAPRKKPGMPTIAVFIDVDNTNASRDNLLEIFTSLSLRGTVTTGKLYGYDQALGFDDIIKDNKLETVGKASYKDGNASVVDTRLVVDCMVAAGSKKNEYIFVWAGVGDLASLFQQIQQLKCKTFTLDIPGYDCTNPYVDQKMRLFSPIAKKNVAPPPVQQQVAPAQSQPNAQPAPKTVKPEDMALTSQEMMAKVDPSAMKKMNPATVVKTDDEFDNFDWDSIDGDDTSFDFDESELDGLDDLEKLYASDDDDADYEDLLEDFADLNVETDSGNEVIGLMSGDYDNSNLGGNNSETMSVSENERLLAITEQMLHNMQKGGKVDAKAVAEELSLDDESLGIPPFGEEERKSLYSHSVFEYALDDGADAPSDLLPLEEEGPDEYSDFGKV